MFTNALALLLDCRGVWKRARVTPPVFALARRGQGALRLNTGMGKAAETHIRNRRLTHGCDPYGYWTHGSKIHKGTDRGWGEANPWWITHGFM